MVGADSTINRAHQHAMTLRRGEEPAGGRAKCDTGGESNYTNQRADPPDMLGVVRVEGMSTKIHQAGDWPQPPVCDRADARPSRRLPMFETLLSHLAVGRIGLGEPRARRIAPSTDCPARRQRLLPLARSAASSAPAASRPRALRPDRAPQTTRPSWRRAGRFRREDLQESQTSLSVPLTTTTVARNRHPATTKSPQSTEHHSSYEPSRWRRREGC